jgi:hypothetical protein
MKILAKRLLTITVAITMLLSPFGNFALIKPASAYVAGACSWNSTDRVDLDYRNVNMTSTMWDPTTRSLALWNDVSDKISLVSESPSGDHEIDFVKHTLAEGTPA